MKLLEPCKKCGSTHVRNVCGFCGQPSEPIKNETLILIAGGLILAGFIIGSLITFSASL